MYALRKQSLLLFCTKKKSFVFLLTWPDLFCWYLFVSCYLVSVNVVCIKNVLAMAMAVSDSIDIPTYETGQARYGNFINYYSFHPAENRIRLFPDYLKYVVKKPKRIFCLDVGCNTGELTHALHEHLTRSCMKDDVNTGRLECYILAVDLDQNLIERATETNQNELISFICADMLSDDFKTICDQYLQKHCQRTFDIAYCLSVTMWVHINHGDEGLKQFIINLSRIADFLVIEPQPWKCYGRAVRRMKRTNSQPFEEFSKLKIRNEVENYIDTFLFEHCSFKKILQTAPTPWGRQIKFYKRTSKNELDT